MPRLVTTLEELVANVKEYQRAAKQPSTRITPSLVRSWYYIPALNMVAASRFIGYKEMTAELYEQSHEVDGKVTEPHLQRKGWFRPITEDEPIFENVRTLAASLDRYGRLYPTARFYVLRDIYKERGK